MADTEENIVETTGIRGFIQNFAGEVFGNPLNLVLLGVCGFLLLKIVRNKRAPPPKPPEPQLPQMKKKDLTLEQLREFDGKGPDGRLLMAVNGKVFDVTRGKRFYGPGMNLVVHYCIVYIVLSLSAGKTCQLGLATFFFFCTSFPACISRLSSGYWVIELFRVYVYVG